MSSESFRWIVKMVVMMKSQTEIFCFFNGGYSPLLMLLSNSSNLVGLHTELVLCDLGLKSTLHEVIHSSPTGH